MARPRQFEEAVVLDAAVEHFWLFGYQAASIRELAASMGINSASLYNAFGDKRALFRIALARYVEVSIESPMRRVEEEFSSRKPLKASLKTLLDIPSGIRSKRVVCW